VKLGSLAAALNLPFQGDPDHELHKLASIASATESDLSFVVGQRYKQQLINSNAGAVIVPESMSALAPGNVLVSKNPYSSYARASWLLTPERRPAAGISASAEVHESAKISPGAFVGAFSVVGANTVVGDDAVIGEHCVLGSGVNIGRGSRLFARVTVHDECVIGDDCRLQTGVVIGGEGFGYAPDNGWQAIHQTGRVVLGNKVHIGVNSAIDRGAIDDTVVADGVIMDNHVQIAHNVHIGQNTAIAGCVGVAGSTVIGANCQIGGASNIVGHLKICDGVILNATSFVSQSIDEPGRYSSGAPLQPDSEWKRTFVVMSKLNDLYKRVRRLERNPQSSD